MITTCMIMDSVDNTVPPVFIFPRARLHDSLMFGAPPGSLGLVKSPQSNWITRPLFLKVLEHVKKHTRISKEDRSFLLMNNNESHHTLDSNLYTREYGITLLTFPPLYAHRLQPLNVGVMGPFKGELCVAQRDCMTANPGKVITIHDLTSLTIAVYQASFTVKNITAAFVKPSTWPFSRFAFSDVDFEPSSVVPMQKELCNQEIPDPSASTPVAEKFLGLAKVTSHRKMCVHSQNLNQDVTEDKGGWLSLTF